MLAPKRLLAGGGKLTRLSSFPQERADFLTNSLHVAPVHAMSATAVEFDQLCVKQLGKRGRRERVYKPVLPIHDDERLSAHRSGCTLQ